MTDPAKDARREKIESPVQRWAPPFVGEGMVTRRVVVRACDVVFVKGIVEASEGLAQVFAEGGGDLTLAAPKEREAELDALVVDLVHDVDALVDGL